MHPIARKEELVIQEVAGEILIYDLRTNKAICLNQTSALVWQNCDGSKNVSEIAFEMEKRLHISVGEDLVWFALNQLEKESLLINREKVSNKFGGLTRREIVKRIGVTAAIGLPVVSSLIAPTAVMAQTSCLPTGMGGYESGGFGLSLFVAERMLRRTLHERNVLAFTSENRIL